MLNVNGLLFKQLHHEIADAIIVCCYDVNIDTEKNVYHFDRCRDVFSHLASDRYYSSAALGSGPSPAEAEIYQ